MEPPLPGLKCRLGGLRKAPWCDPERLCGWCRYTMTSVVAAVSALPQQRQFAVSLALASRREGVRGAPLTSAELEPLEQDLANGPGGSDAPALAIIWSWVRESDEPRAEPSSTCAGPGCDGSNGRIAASRLDELGIGSWLARCSSVPGVSLRCIITMPWGRHGAYAVCSPRAVTRDGSLRVAHFKKRQETQV